MKGIFVLIVFFSHFSGYISLDVGRYNVLFRTVNTAIGQLMVVMFFFYSGYGVAAQLIKRPDYMKDFLVRRLFQVWLRFAVCVVFFVILNMLMGTLGQYSRLHIVLAFSGYTAIGNSNWFMFDTFVLYFLCWLVFFWHGELTIPALTCFSLLSAGFNFWLYRTQPSWWWNTLFVFPVGMWFAYFRPMFEATMRRPIGSLAVLAPLLSAFLALWYVQIKVLNLRMGYILLAVLFALSVASLTTKIRLGNPVLYFFGRHAFSIYILQRIPMILFRGKFSSTAVYFFLCFTVTVLCAVLFDSIYDKAFARLLPTNKERG